MRIKEDKQRYLYLALWAAFCALIICILGGVILFELQLLREGEKVTQPLPPTPAIEVAQVSPVVLLASPSVSLSPTGTPLLDPTITMTPEPTLDPVAATIVAGGNGSHVVLPEDTLEGIAIKYGVAIQDIRIANGMIGDTILAGQTLVIPGQTNLASPAYQFSVLQGDLALAYPLAYQASRFSLHYAPNTYPSYAFEALAGLEQTALDHLERLFGRSLGGHFDVYVAGSLFEPPDRHLRGRSFSQDLVNLILFDGSGSPVDQQYMFAHELTHLYTWNVFGIPPSVMLSEGAAVYAGTELIFGSGQIPLETFCAAILQAGELPYISSSLRFSGHNYDLENYYAAGCFVKYLVQAYGAEMFGRVYPSDDYAAVYGRSLQGLEDDWRSHLGTVAVEEIDPQELVAVTNDVTTAYEWFFPNFDGSQAHIEAYRELDAARMAMLAGKFELARQKLDEFRRIYLGS